ncbi:MAG TPA: hypothetical protein VE615_02535 [Gaiellaceae bacterium]|nr:hypothetical protein [Gaiellaceae bacterium]
MVARTESSNATKPRRNNAARFSFLFALLGVLALPAAVAVTEYHDELRLLHAGFGVPVAFVFSALGVWLARRGRRNYERTLGRVGGRGIGRAGRILGWIGIYVSLLGAASLAVYALEFFVLD